MFYYRPLSPDHAFNNVVKNIIIPWSLFELNLWLSISRFMFYASARRAISISTRSRIPYIRPRLALDSLNEYFRQSFGFDHRSPDAAFSSRTIVAGCCYISPSSEPTTKLRKMKERLTLIRILRVRSWWFVEQWKGESNMWLWRRGTRKPSGKSDLWLVAEIHCWLILIPTWRWSRSNNAVKIDDIRWKVLDERPEF